ncbi:MAG: hypothetical protein DME34_00060 [Verrucomicrobia bacterium]|nr:MAG: hypothetical protein DME34_00060 [Verrucomicrobiota bacterium]
MLDKLDHEHARDHDKRDANRSHGRIFRGSFPSPLWPRDQCFTRKPGGDLRRNGQIADQPGHDAIELLLVFEFRRLARAGDRRAHGAIVDPTLANRGTSDQQSVAPRQTHHHYVSSSIGTTLFSQA